MRTAFLCLVLLFAPSTAIAQTVRTDAESLFLTLVRRSLDPAFEQALDDDLLLMGRTHCDGLTGLGEDQYIERITTELAIHEFRTNDQRMRQVIIPTLASAMNSLCPEFSGN